MSEPRPYITPDSVVGLGPQNSVRRNLTLIACPLCKNDFEVRDGQWVSVTFPSRRQVQLKICDNCAKDEKCEV